MIRSRNRFSKTKNRRRLMKNVKNLHTDSKIKSHSDFKMKNHINMNIKKVISTAKE
jgi:ribosomal protein L32